MVESGTVERACFTDLKLNLGCGYRGIDGYVGIDCIKTECTDIVHDLEDYPWPFDDNSVQEALIIHFLEHIGDLNAFMDELYRVMKDGGIVGVEGPYWTSVGSWQDPTHKYALSQELFYYFDKRFRDSQQMPHYPSKANFQIIDVRYQLNDDYKKLMASGKITEDEIKWAIAHNVNVVSNFAVILRTVK